jgi:hypothetical protein
MPRISEFSGISIELFFHDHPPPHVHVTYGGNRARIAISSGDPISGKLPRRQLNQCDNG